MVTWMNVGQKKTTDERGGRGDGAGRRRRAGRRLGVAGQINAPQGQPGGLAARSTASPATSQQAVAGDDESRQLAELQQLCSLDLRKPLFEGPKALQAASAPPLPQSTMTVRLVGMVDEPGHSMAMFQKSDGAIVLCARARAWSRPACR